MREAKTAINVMMKTAAKDPALASNVQESLSSWQNTLLQETTVAFNWSKIATFTTATVIALLFVIPPCRRFLSLKLFGRKKSGPSTDPFTENKENRFPDPIASPLKRRGYGKDDDIFFSILKEYSTQRKESKKTSPQSNPSVF